MMAVNQIEEQIREKLLPQCFNAAVKAGAAIMKIYKNRDDYDISIKSDKTPITVADRVGGGGEGWGARSESRII